MTPGIYDLPFEDYLKADGCSQSMLKILGQSPAHLRAYLDGEKKETTTAMKLGTVIHSAILQPDLLLDSIHLRPETCKTAKGCIVPWDLKTNDAQAWMDSHKDKPVVSSSELETVYAIAESARSHPAAKMALFTKGKAEQSLFATDPETGALMKCRADWLSGEACVDLKTTEDASPLGFAKSISSYQYDVQAAVTLDICEQLSLGKKYFIFIAVEKVPPFATAVYQLDEASIEKGRMKYRYWLAQYCECVRTGEWPGYPTTIEVIKLSDWAMRRAA